MLVLLAAACLAWIALLAVAFVGFTGVGASAAWSIAGGLVLVMIAGAVLMNREYRNAIDLTKHSARHRTGDSSPVPARFKTEGTWTANSFTDREILLTGRRDKPKSGNSRRRRPSHPKLR